MSYTDFSGSNWLEGTYSTSSYDEPISIVAWIKLSASDWADITLQRHILSFTDNTGAETNSFVIGTNVGSTADRAFAIQRASSGNSVVYDATDGQYDDIWVPLIGVYSSNTSRTVYLENSSQTASAGLDYGVTLGSTPVVYVGKRLANSYGMLGRVAELAIFNKALLATEVDSLQTAPGQGIPPILVAPQNCIGYWPLRDNQSNHVDESRYSNGPTLTINGSPTYSSDHPIISALPKVKCRLIQRDGTIHQNLTNIKWAWFDETDPQNFNAPTNTGTVETTDVDGFIEVNIPGTSLVAGQLGCLALSTSDNVDLGLYKLVIY